MEKELQTRLDNRERWIEELKSKGQKATEKLTELYCKQKEDMTRLLKIQTKRKNNA